MWGRATKAFRVANGSSPPGFQGKSGQENSRGFGGVSGAVEYKPHGQKTEGLATMPARPQDFVGHCHILVGQDAPLKFLSVCGRDSASTPMLSGRLRGHSMARIIRTRRSCDNAAPRAPPPVEPDG